MSSAREFSMSFSRNDHKNSAELTRESLIVVSFPEVYLYENRE